MSIWYLHTNTVNDYCWYNTFSNQQVAEIIALGQSIEHQAATISDNKINKEVRDTEVSWIKPDEKSEWLYRDLTDIALEANKKYFNFDLSYIEQLQYTVYNKDGFYDYHVDCANQSAGEFPRKLSFTLQLSDPSEYQGGDVMIQTSSKPYPIKREKGTITFFPSYILHKVTPVTKGVRKSLVGWIHGPKWR